MWQMAGIFSIYNCMFNARELAFNGRVSVCRWRQGGFTKWHGHGRPKNSCCGEEWDEWDDDVPVAITIMLRWLFFFQLMVDICLISLIYHLNMIYVTMLIYDTSIEFNWYPMIWYMLISVFFQPMVDFFSTDGRFSIWLIVFGDFCKPDGLWFKATYCFFVRWIE